MLVADYFQEARLVRLFVEFDKNTASISFESLGAKGVVSVEHLYTPFVCRTQHSPTNTGFPKSVHKPDFNQVQKAQGQTVANRIKLPVPKWA